MSDDNVTTMISIRLPKSLIDRIDTYRSTITMKPSRSQMVRWLIENAMDIVERTQSNDSES